MLEKLDTVIAFAVVMLGVSLIITILTQMVSTLLGLRGANLLWGIETLLGELDPTLAKKLADALPPDDPLSTVRKMAETILTDNLISDSTFSRAGQMWLIGPIIRFIMRIPGIGWVLQRWRRATAIRPEELARMLDKKATALGAFAAGLPVGSAAATAATEAATALTNILTATDRETERQLQRLKSALASFVPAAPPAAPVPPAVPGAVAVPVPAATMPPGYAVQVDKIFQQVTEAAQQSVGRLEAWFNTTMDRVSQRFAVQVRLWTVVFAFAIAFGAHLDSLNLLDQLWTNPGIRTALVDMRDGMLKEATAVLPPAGAAATSEVPVSPTILNEALDKLKESNQFPAATGKIPDNITTVSDAIAWLKQQPNAPADFDMAYRKATISVLQVHAVGINQDLVKAGIQLVPSPYPGVFNYPTPKNFLGILGAAALLSLGAPFWYNALKNLSNLRTVVANKQDQEQAAK